MHIIMQLDKWGGDKGMLETQNGQKQNGMEPEVTIFPCGS